ncbi:MAG TPA: hypothetical protein VFA08_01285 [Actinomycetota bacterium]|jgi:hypothetical protein|nr:hypothetical protein [Actinomycetota bacterium]
MIAAFLGWTYKNLLDKARRDLQRLQEAKTATSDDAINFVCTAAPLREWLEKDDRPAAGAAAGEMKTECRGDPAHPVQLVWDVCNGLKHVERRRTSVQTETIDTGAQRGGAGLRGNPPFTLRGGPVDVFMIEVNGRWERLSDVGARALAAWERVLTKHGLPV